jgi:hypothetical protein
MHTYKIETPYHDNDLIMTPIISSQSGWQWTWSCSELHMGGFRDGGWQFLVHKWNFLAINPIASQLFLCLFWISLWLRIGVYNTLASKQLCKIVQASKNSDSKAQHFLSDLLTHSWFHSMLFALPSYQFPYIVMNKCLYLMSSLVLLCLSANCTMYITFTTSTWVLGNCLESLEKFSIVSSLWVSESV